MIHPFKRLMVIEQGYFRFEKAPDGNMVIVYERVHFVVNGTSEWTTRDAFTNYDIKDSFDRLQEACGRWLEEQDDDLEYGSLEERQVELLAMQEDSEE